MEKEVTDPARQEAPAVESLEEKSEAENLSSSQREINGQDGSISKEDAAANEFNPGLRFYMSFAALAVLALMVSWDGTSVSVALPVRLLSF
jgi:hypothetical protein